MVDPLSTYTAAWGHIGGMQRLGRILSELGSRAIHDLDRRRRDYQFGGDSIRRSRRVVKASAVSPTTPAIVAARPDSQV